MEPFCGGLAPRLNALDVRRILFDLGGKRTLPIRAGGALHLIAVRPSAGASVAPLPGWEQLALALLSLLGALLTAAASAVAAASDALRFASVTAAAVAEASGAPPIVEQ